MTNTKEEPMRNVPRWGWTDPHTGDYVEVYADTAQEAEERLRELYPLSGLREEKQMQDAIEHITLVKHPFGCYALEAPGVPEDREPFFQIDTDIASLAEMIGYQHALGSWEELPFEQSLEVIAGAYDYLDDRDGQTLDVGIFDAYFSTEDRGWE